MTRRRLSLSKQTLTEITPDELRGVAGGDYTGNTRCWLSIDPCVTLLSCTLCVGPVS